MIFIQLHGFNVRIIVILRKWLNSSTLPIDETITSTITLGQSGPGSNGNEGVLHIPQNFRTVSSSSDAVQCHTEDAYCVCVGGVLHFFR